MRVSYSITLLFILIFHCGKAQIIDLGDDTTICPGPISIVNDNPAAPNFIQLDDTNQVLLADDQYSGLVPIGFDFTFYGQTYDSLVIGSNIILSFDKTLANGYCPWSITGPLPSTIYSKPAIFPSYMDVNPGFGGTIVYQTVGTAPNREFVVVYNNVIAYQCFPPCWSAAVVLYEGSNIVEIFLKDKPLCTGWNSGYSIQGLQNENATIAHIVPGNQPPDLWTVDLDGKQFIPNGPNDYVINNIPFTPVLYGNVQYSWSNTEGENFPYSDTLSTTVTFGDELAYFLTVSSPELCSGELFSLSDSSWIDVPSTGYDLEVVNDFCGLNSGSITSQTATNDAAFYWTELDVYSDTLTNLVAGNYPFVFTDQLGCATPDTVYIQSDSSYSATFDYPTCQDDLNGTITISPYISGISYDWIVPAGSDTNFLNNLGEGTYSCIVSAGGNCIDTIEFTLISPSQFAITSETIENVTCFGIDDGSYQFTFTSSLSPVTKKWDGVNLTPDYILLQSSGWHQLILSNSAGCQLVHDVYIDGPSEPFEVSADVMPALNGSNGSVTFVMTGGDGTIISCSVNGVQQAGPTFYGLIPGNYTALVTDSWGCQVQVSFTVGNTVGLAENSAEHAIIYPIPSSSYIFIEAEQEPQAYEIVDLNGRIIEKGKYEKLKGISVRNIANGSYQLRFILNNGEISISPIQVEH